MNPEDQNPLQGATPAAEPVVGGDLPNLGDAPAPVAPEAIPMGAIPAGSLMGAVPASALTDTPAPVETPEASASTEEDIPVSSSIQTKPSNFGSDIQEAAPAAEPMMTVEAPAAMTAPEPAVEAPDLSQLSADLADAAANGSLEAPIEEAPAETSSEALAEAPVDTSTIETTPAPTVDLGGDIPAPEIPEGGKLTLAPLSPTEETPATDEPAQEILIGQPLDTPAAPAETPADNQESDDGDAIGVVGVAKAATAPTDQMNFDPIAMDPIAQAAPAPAPTPVLTPEAPAEPAGLQPIMQADGTAVAVPDLNQPAPVEEAAPAPDSLAAAIAEDEAMYSAPETPAEQPATVEVPADQNGAKQVNDDGEIKPANPVPGSIGSAFAYSESAPDHSSKVILKKYKAPKQQATPEQAQKNKMMIIIGGAIAAAVIIIVLIILLITSGGSKTTTTTTDNNQSFAEPEFSSMSCTMKIPDLKLADYNAQSGDSKILITFYGGEFYDATLGQVLTYTDEEAANNGKTLVRSEYNRSYFSRDLSADPFESRYSVSGPVLTVTHYADEKTMTSNTAPIFNFPVDEDDQAQLDEDSIKTAYTKLGYTCNANGSK